MKYLGKITDNKDLVTKEYVDGSIPATYSAENITIADSSGYFSATTAEGALAELAAGATTVTINTWTI